MALLGGSSEHCGDTALPTAKLYADESVLSISLDLEVCISRRRIYVDTAPLTAKLYADESV